MILRRNSYLYHICQDILLELIIGWQIMKTYWAETSTHQHVRSLPKQSKLTTTDLNEWLKTMPKVQNSYINILDRYQKVLKKKFTEVEAAYYEHVDELTQKLGDLDSKFEDVDFNLHQFKFIEEWELGLIDSQRVHNIIQNFDAEEIAYVTMTRRINNFMFRHEETSDYVKYTLVKIKENAVPLYTKYIDLLKRFFEKAADCDKKQEKLTWVTVTLVDNNTRTNYAEDFTLNQAVRQIDAYIIEHIDQTFYLGENLICLNETADSKGIIRSHWLFAPRTYINFLKSVYTIKTALDFKDDGDYIRKMIAEHING